MAQGKKIVGVTAPASGIKPALAERVKELAAGLYPDDRLELRFHPQCFLAAGHFAGPDEARSAAFLETANDPDIDAVWFARGGYGSCRLDEGVFAKLNDAARRKQYLGYSDIGLVLARLYKDRVGKVAHGPIPADINREGGDAALKRALAYLVHQDPETLEPGISPGQKTLAFNIKMLSELLGTAYEPDFTDHVLMLEEVGEYMYRIDRSFFHITSNPRVRKAAGIRLGRCSDIPANDPPFEFSEEEVAQYWCDRAGIPYLGRADIGHDAENKIVPFGVAPVADGAA